jgi:hypothetical protein
VEHRPVLVGPRRRAAVALEVDGGEPERTLREPAKDLDHALVDAELTRRSRDLVHHLFGERTKYKRIEDHDLHASRAERQVPCRQRFGDLMGRHRRTQREVHAMPRHRREERFDEELLKGGESARTRHRRGDTTIDGLHFDRVGRGEPHVVEIRKRDRHRQGSYDGERRAILGSRPIAAGLE